MLSDERIDKGNLAMRGESVARSWEQKYEEEYAKTLESKILKCYEVSDVEQIWGLVKQVGVYVWLSKGWEKEPKECMIEWRAQNSSWEERCCM